MTSSLLIILSYALKPATEEMYGRFFLFYCSVALQSYSAFSSNSLDNLQTVVLKTKKG